ncbi:MAG: 3-hydroxyacyl-CoA dehydrogenase [Sporichthyaceae bacterium]|nr:3-hydroxyacyl-CoA dehydrogenase [Sporichthyaceae bacterium]
MATPDGTLLTVAVIGAGTMGAGIAQVAAVAGHEVLLHDVDPTVADRAVAGIGVALDRLARLGRISAGDRAAAVGRVRVATALADVAAAGLVVEVVVERLDVKRPLFADLEAVVGPDTILASNTSSLSITQIATGLEHPDRVVGMHFFNPAPVLALVEVVSGAATDPAVADRVVALAEAWGKTPIRTTSTPGFVVNRVARPYYGEAFRAYEEGVADPATIDALLREAGGFRMGPFELTDLIGHDVNAAVSHSVWSAFGYDARFTPSMAQRALVDAGRLGRKSGRGWYTYDSDGAPIDRPEPATAPPAEPPAFVVRLDDRLAPLVERAAAGGVESDADAWTYVSSTQPIEWAEGSQPFRHPITGEPLQGGVVTPNGGLLRLTDGRTATELTGQSLRNVFVLDVAADLTTASRVALAVPHGAPPDVTGEVVGFLQAAGLAVSVVDDNPGLVVARTLAMLVNLAADAVHLGVATAADVDLAMTKGVNYPYGPLASGDRLGPAWVVEVLDHLSAAYGDGRYRVSPWLRRRAQTGRSLR